MPSAHIWELTWASVARCFGRWRCRVKLRVPCSTVHLCRSLYAENPGMVAQRAWTRLKPQVVGNTIQCPFHGWSFDGSGKCSLADFQDEQLQLQSVSSPKKIDQCRPHMNQYVGSTFHLRRANYSDLCRPHFKYGLVSGIFQEWPQCGLVNFYYPSISELCWWFVFQSSIWLVNKPEPHPCLDLGEKHLGGVGKNVTEICSYESLGFPKEMRVGVEIKKSNKNINRQEMTRI